MGEMILSGKNAAFKNDYVDGLFVIDCLEIKLTQNGVEKPQIYTAIGSLHVGPENGVESRLVIPREVGNPYDPFEDIMKAANGMSGVLFSESQYYKLEARDTTQNIWTSPSVFVKIENKPNAIILAFRCDTISTESHIEKPQYSTRMIFVDALDFPKNVFRTQNDPGSSQTQVSSISSSSAGYPGELLVKFNSRDDKSGVKFSELYSESQGGVVPPVQFQDRLLEAIRFCTATLASPVFSETVHGNRLTIELSRAHPLNSGMISPPLATGGNHEEFYKLMACYYKYACANSSGRDFAPLSAKLGGLFTLKGVWVDTIALLVAVAVESLLKDEPFKNLGKPSKEMAGEIEKLFAWVKKATLAGKLIERALSTMGSMKSNRAADKLYALVEAGAIHEADRKAWTGLRNPAAHGSFEINPLEMQKLVDDVYRLSTLIYKLVFIKIGYSGEYSDRSTHGWPTAFFDLPTYLAAIEAKSLAESIPVAE